MKKQAPMRPFCFFRVPALGQIPASQFSTMRTPSTIAALIFDMDGLLVDSEPIWQRAEREIVRTWGSSWTEEDAVSCRGTGIPETAKRMAERAGREFDPILDPAKLVDVFFELCGSVREKKGARTLIERANSANVPTAVASSSPARVVEKILDSTKLRPLFGAVVSGDDVTKKKPDPEIFQLAAERSGARPRTCLVFEDSMPGVLGAKNAAMAVIAVPEVDAHTFEGVADAVAKDLDEAASWLEF